MTSGPAIVPCTTLLSGAALVPGNFSRVTYIFCACIFCACGPVQLRLFWLALLKRLAQLLSLQFRRVCQSLVRFALVVPLLLESCELGRLLTECRDGEDGRDDCAD